MQPSRELQERQDYINDLINIRDAHLDRYEAEQWYTGHLRVFELIGSRMSRSRIHSETIQWYLDCYDPSQNGNNLRNQAEAFSTIGTLANCRTAVVLYPLMEGFETGYPLAAIHQKARTMAQNAGLPVLDLAPVFANRKTSDLWVHPTDHHPNGAAHALAAAAILEWLRKDLPGFLEKEGE